MTLLIGVAAIILLAVFLASQTMDRQEAAVLTKRDETPDLPRAFGYKMAWLAVRTDDPSSLAQWLGLTDGRPANWNAGVGTVYDDEMGDGKVFVTPSLDGWTFVLGLSLPHPVTGRFVDKLTPILMRLGAQYQDVQYYFTYPLIDFFAWARVKDGRLVRGFAVNDEGVVWNKGKITPEERALGLRLFELRGVRERQGDAGGELVLYPTEAHVLRIAEAWGINPVKLEDRAAEPETGLLASTPYAWRPERRQRAA